MTTVTLSPSPVVTLGAAEADSSIEVLVRAFAGYPVMIYSFGDLGPLYEPALRSLFRYSFTRRLIAGWPLLGINCPYGQAAVAGIDLPGETPHIAALSGMWQMFNTLIGSVAAHRFMRYVNTAERFRPLSPHVYLGVIGVLPGVQGQGYGRALLAAVHALAASHPTATGVYLDTETAENVALYQHLGYQVIGHERVDTLDVWGMFRPNQQE